MSDRPPTLTVRWWREPADRFLSRAEYSEMKRRPHFNLSEIPRGDNPELDAEVAALVDRGGCFGAWSVVPMAFERLDPDPLADVMVALRYPPPPIKPFFATGELVGVTEELYDDDEYREDDE